MSFLKKLFSVGKDPASYAFRRKRAEELHGQAIRYVTEQRDGNEDVVGRGGHLTLKDDRFLVDTSGDTLFACPVADLDAAYLMSGDGVILRGPNLLEGGRERTLTVHFVYYRK